VPEKAAAGHRVEKVQLLALRPELEAQRLASQDERPVQRLHRRLRPVPAPGQAPALQLHRQVFRGRVVLPVPASEVVRKKIPDIGRRQTGDAADTIPVSLGPLHL